ncbi:MAG: rRNA maturation RNase YbeY [Neisseriaceae bacterium]
MNKRRLRPSYYQLRAKRVSLALLNEAPGFSLPKRSFFLRCIYEAMQRNYSYAQIGLLLCSKEVASRYNFHYRKKNYATNVLSFPLNETQGRACLLGDLILCPEVIEAEAMEQNKDVLAHYAHLVVHGILHLLGYDHVEPIQACAMEAREIDILQSMGYSNPYEVVQRAE